MKCRFCTAHAVAVFDLPEGCLCYPHDREQSLCPHHAFKANPIGDMVLKKDLTVGKKFTHAWEKRDIQAPVPPGIFGSNL